MPGTNLTRVEAEERARTAQPSAYEISLDLSGSDSTFLSTTTIHFDGIAGASTFVDLISSHVRTIELNGQPVDPSAHQDSRIELRDIQETNTLKVVADCAYMNTGEGLHRFVDPADNETYVYSQFEVPDARRVFAVFEQPDLKATFQFTVTVPEHWTVFSNSETPTPVPLGEGKARFDFEPSHKISSYITAIVAGPYKGHTGSLTSSDGREIPLGVYCRASMLEFLDAEEIMDITKAGFAFYERQFERPYPFSKYDQIFVPEYNAGAMENAGCVTYRDQYVFRSKPTEAVVERRAQTILHELAHMWFGNLVTMKWWNDLWLNESFAEYMATLSAAEATRWTDAWTTFSALEKSWAYEQDQLPSTHPIVASIRDLEDVEVNFDGITYAKGASVLSQLVTYVGRDNFFTALRRYFAKHEWSNTVLDDLLRELEEASGRDLSQWSRVWLENAGLTRLEPVLNVEDDGTITSCSIKQSKVYEGALLRPHRMAIGTYNFSEDGKALERKERIEVDVDEDWTAIPELVESPMPAVLLINDDDLAYAKVRLDPASLETAMAHITKFPDSLSRGNVAAIVWDMVRDAELPAGRYVDTALLALGVEEQPTVMRVLLANLDTAVEDYTHISLRDELRKHAGSRLARLGRVTPAGSDAQLQLIMASARMAFSPEDFEGVRRLIDGEETLAGLTIDTDLRWELLASLVRGGYAGRDEIDRALSLDQTVTGHEWAAYCMAAQPTEDAKRDAWNSLLHDVKIPNSRYISIARGFSSARDPQLLVPYVEDYFDNVERIWNERTLETGQSFLQLLYPSSLVLADSPYGRDIEALTQEWLDTHQETPDALKRLMVEQLADTRRALSAQAASVQ
ncbi:MAG: aminopeptidase N [Actinomycetaceae bacterium]|nr:aminopeptidase N [Actinomycetaceae bacterium]